MRLKHLFRGYDYRARVHYSVDDVNLVPLDSIQTDDFQELVNFILVKAAQGFYVHWRTPTAGIQLIPGTSQMYQENPFQPLEQEVVA